MNLRVWVTDVWDTVTVAATPEMSVGALKRAALSEAMGRPVEAADHAVKFRGALIADEGRTMGQLHAGDRAPFIVLPARRQPVR
jgi:hypothetical protein